VLPHKHFILSALIGAAGWWGTGTPAAGAAALAAGVLPDVDHIVDYAYYYWRRDHRLIVPLHGYEFAILGTGIALLTGDALLGIAVLSYAMHLAADQAENRTHLLGYSLLYRALNRFRIESLSTVPEAAVRGRMADIKALERLQSSWRK
jgi:hypothetical protein